MKFPNSILLGTSLGLLAACGSGAKAPSRDVTVTPVPAFPDIKDNVFALQDGKTSVGYKSTMLFINPYTQATLLADIIGKSELTRIKAADAKSFVGDEKAFDRTYGDSGEKAQEIAKQQAMLQSFLTAAEQRGEPIAIAERQRLIGEWMAGEGRPTGLTVEEDLQLKTHLANYCDAKVLEFASHPGFAKLAPNGYASRPSPHQFCEAYYAEKNYFQGPSCEAGGNTFHCLWSEGVLKSGAFVGAQGPTVKADLELLLQDPEKTEILRKILSADEAQAAPYVKATLSIYKDNIYKKKSYFYAGLLSGEPGIGKESNCKAMLEPSYHFICGSLGQSWKAKTAQSTLLDIELSSGLKNLAKNNEKLNYLSLVLRYYGVRSRTGGVQFSRSDYFFHELTAGNTIARPPLNSSEFPPLDETQVLSVFLDKISLLAPEDKIKQKEMGQTFIALIDDFRYHRAERDRLTEEAGAALIEGIKSANAGDVALGFIAYRMVVNHAPTMMRVRLNFEGFSNKVFEGCFDKQLLVPSSCSPDAFGLEAGLQIRPATLLLNPARGRIELTLAIDNPAEVGLGFAAKKEASPDYFMLIPEEQIQGTSLVFELYPNRLQNSLDILTGKALFQREGVTLYEAGISMWEE